MSSSDSESEPTSSNFPTIDIAPTQPPIQVPFPRRMNPILQRVSRASHREPSSEECQTPILDDYAPIPAQVAIVRGLLGKLGLPLELAATILNYADYKVKIRAQRSQYKNVASMTGARNSIAHLYLVTPHIRAKVDSVKFAFLSHDQGWANPPPSDDPYSCSYSWFEATILRNCVTGGEKSVDSLIDTHYGFTEDAIPALEEVGYRAVDIDGKTVWPLQSNVTASKEDRTHIVTWNNEEDFVKALKTGDKIAIWARAQYPGWENHVKRVEVEFNYETQY